MRYLLGLFLPPLAHHFMVTGQKHLRHLAALPQSLLAVRDDVEQNFRAVLKSSLSRMDLVTREEFDVQQAVLARTRDKLAALEARLAALEAPPAKADETGDD